jgi:hypothetical protein
MKVYLLFDANTLSPDDCVEDFVIGVYENIELAVSVACKLVSKNYPQRTPEVVHDFGLGLKNNTDKWAINTLGRKKPAEEYTHYVIREMEIVVNGN